MSLLNGTIEEHATGMAPIASDNCGYAIDLSPLDFESKEGNLVLWNAALGGEKPWELGYFTTTSKTSIDLEYITKHAPDSASTATAIASGIKTSTDMLAVDLYENEVPTLIEEALSCEKAAGTVTSMPVLHATPGAFISHSNNRNNHDQIRQGFRKVNPTLAVGTCLPKYCPFPSDVESMKQGSLSSQWTVLEISDEVPAGDFYSSVQDLDPDSGDHLLVCLGNRLTLPYRGVDGDPLSKRWCSSGKLVYDDTNGSREVIGVEPTTSDGPCNYYSAEEVDHLPHISTSVLEALKFLSKDKDGFFLLFEQGDVSAAECARNIAYCLKQKCQFDSRSCSFFFKD